MPLSQNGARRLHPATRRNSRQRRNTRAADFARLHRWGIAEHIAIVTRAIPVENCARRRQQAARPRHHGQQAVGEICYWQAACVSGNFRLFGWLFQVVAQQLAGVAHDIGPQLVERHPLAVIERNQPGVAQLHHVVFGRRLG